MTNREIIAENLVKRYSSGALAVDGVSFKVNNGEIFGFLGPNGAGKSTTVAMLTTLMLPSEGRAWVGGWDVVADAEKVRRTAGVALQEIGLDPLMKPLELLIIQAQLFGANRSAARQRARDLLEIVKLSEVADRRVGQFSGGMRRRLDLALALAHEPEILFLDEPTTGLDPVSRRDIWNEVRRLNRQQGMTIFLTTQYLEEADELAGRVAIIDAGRIAAEGAPDVLKRQLGAESINLNFADAEAVMVAARELRNMVDSVQADATVLRAYLPAAAAAVPAVVNRLKEIGLEPLSLTVTQPTLDDVFLQVTGQRFKDAAEVDSALQEHAQIAR